MDKVGEDTLKAMESASWYKDWLFSLIKPHVHGEILEVGAGIGNFTNLLKTCGKITVIDIQKNYVKSLKEKFKGNVSIGMGDIEKGNYFFNIKKFDSIVCINVLEHIKNQEKAILNMKDLLEKRGKLVLLIPAYEPLYSRLDRRLGHYRRYNKKEVKKLLIKSGFKICSLHYVNWFGAIGWFVFLTMTGRKQLPKKCLLIFDKLGRLFLLPEKIINPPFGLSLLVVAKKI